MQQIISAEEQTWESIVYDIIDFPPIETVLQNFNQDFVKKLPSLDENFISNVLNNIP